MDNLVHLDPLDVEGYTESISVCSDTLITIFALRRNVHNLKEVQTAQ